MRITATSVSTPSGRGGEQQDAIDLAVRVQFVDHLEDVGRGRRVRRDAQAVAGKLALDLPSVGRGRLVRTADQAEPRLAAHAIRKHARSLLDVPPDRVRDRPPFEQTGGHGSGSQQELAALGLRRHLP